MFPIGSIIDFGPVSLEKIMKIQNVKTAQTILLYSCDCYTMGGHMSVFCVVGFGGASSLSNR